jgi:hypothetical protein
MKKDQPIAEGLPSNALLPPEKSFSVAFEQMAKLLRTEVKMKDRMTKVLSSSSLPSSFQNALKQIAKLLRTKTHAMKPLKKRSWKKHAPKPRKGR